MISFHQNKPVAHHVPSTLINSESANINVIQFLFNKETDRQTNLMQARKWTSFRRDGEPRSLSVSERRQLGMVHADSSSTMGLEGWVEFE